MVVDPFTITVVVGLADAGLLEVLTLLPVPVKDRPFVDFLRVEFVGLVAPVDVGGIAEVTPFVALFIFEFN